MRTLVARRLSAVLPSTPAVGECLERLTATVGRLRHMHSVLDANLNRLDDLAIKLCIEIFGGKGISAHATYPDKTFRDFNDLDIFVRSLADATSLSSELRATLGYRYQKRELPWFKLDPAEDLLYGQIALEPPRGHPDLLNVDIHFGDYSVRHCSRLSITPTFPAGAPGLHMMAPEENIACIVNNAAGDYFVTAKDTNDLLMALSLDTFDIDRLAHQLRRSHLGGFFDRIVETLRASSALTTAQEERLAEVPPVRTMEPRPRSDRADWHRRCIGTTLHAFTSSRQAGILPAVRVAANAFGYYRKRLTLTIDAGRQPSDARQDRIDYTPWTCIRLVPVSMAQELLGGKPDNGEAPRMPENRSFVGDGTDIERFDTPAGTYFRINDEYFVATVSYRLAARLIRQTAVASSAR